MLYYWCVKYAKFVRTPKIFEIFFFTTPQICERNAVTKKIFCENQYFTKIINPVMRLLSWGRLIFL